ncbi:hypothetical protein [Paenibacillus sp. BT-177]|nr:hypothetical protein [Paenibacillus sp. BT-177]
MRNEVRLDYDWYGHPLERVHVHFIAVMVVPGIIDDLPIDHALTL